MPREDRVFRDNLNIYICITHTHHACVRHDYNGTLYTIVTQIPKKMMKQRTRVSYKDISDVSDITDKYNINVSRSCIIETNLNNIH